MKYEISCLYNVCRLLLLLYLHYVYIFPPLVLVVIIFYFLILEIYSIHDVSRAYIVYISSDSIKDNEEHH